MGKRPHLTNKRKFKMSYATKIENLRVELTEKRDELESLRGDLSSLKADYQIKEREIAAFEIDENDYEEQYRQELDESHDLPFGWSMANVMQSQDECMYRQGFNDFLDGIDKTEDQAYKDLESELEDIGTDVEQIEDQIADLESDIEDIEIEIDDLETEADGIED